MSILLGHSVSSILYFALHFYAWLAQENEKVKEDGLQDSKGFDQNSQTTHLSCGKAIDVAHTMCAVWLLLPVFVNGAVRRCTAHHSFHVST